MSPKGSRGTPRGARRRVRVRLDGVHVVRVPLEDDERLGALRDGALADVVDANLALAPHREAPRERSG